MGLLNDLIDQISMLDGEDKISAINDARKALHDISPFRDEPVECVLWVKSDYVKANDYNPNSVAPPEMKLLQLSIEADGYTQPIVACSAENGLEVVDGFHRNRVGKECLIVRQRLNGYLPVVVINDDRADKSDRIAATIRHNRARGKHRIDGMSEIVLELSRINWTKEKIARELGMEPDEVLRLKQIGGLSDLFSDADFSEAWDVCND